MDIRIAEPPLSVFAPFHLGIVVSSRSLRPAMIPHGRGTV